MFQDTAMTMSKDANGKWKVDSAQVLRNGTESYRLAANPPTATDNKPLPFGKPFRVSQPAPNNGRMVATITFDEAFVTPWHDAKTDPFDGNRTVVLVMDVVDAGGSTHQERLLVALSCSQMPHAQVA